MGDDAKMRECREFIRKTNRAPMPDDEYGRISVCDALTGAYDLERYPTPRIPKRRPRADRCVVRGGGVFSFRGDVPLCRV